MPSAARAVLSNTERKPGPLGGKGPPSPPTHQLRWRHRSRSGELAEEAGQCQRPPDKSLSGCRRPAQGRPVSSPSKGERCEALRHRPGSTWLSPPPQAGTRQRPRRQETACTSPLPMSLPVASLVRRAGGSHLLGQTTGSATQVPRRVPSYNGQFSACQWPGLPSDRKLSPG